MARALMRSPPPEESCGPREGGSAVSGAGGAALGADGAGGTGTVAAADGVGAAGSSATGGAGARGASIRGSLGAGAARAGESSRFGGGDALRSGGAGRAGAGGPGAGSSMTWTSTGLETVSWPAGRRSRERNAIWDSRVSTSAAGRGHRGTGARSRSWRLDELPGRDREEEVLGARFTRLEHCLHDDAARGGAVHRDDHARARGREAGPEIGREGVEGDRGAVEEELTLAGHGQGHRSQRGQGLRLPAREVHGHRVQVLERERGEHEGGEEEEHDVDHRDDLDPASATLARRTELHDAPSSASSRRWSTTRVPSCSISSITWACRFEK